jgi:energy-coupling factor transporter ATP-binding protein EcfA2
LKRDEENKDISIEVEEFLLNNYKNTMLLYGSSGSGKSTFLRHLERILLRKFINQETKLIPVYCQLANIN